MPIAPRLLAPINVDIAVVPRGQVLIDPVYREPLMTIEEIIDISTKVRIKAQVEMAQYDQLSMMPPGNDSDTMGKLIYLARDQQKYEFQVNDWVIGIQGLCLANNRLRITHVRPRAQFGVFGLWRIDFKADATGTR